MENVYPTSIRKGYKCWVTSKQRTCSLVDRATASYADEEYYAN
jgi:hypothetical protein